MLFESYISNWLIIAGCGLILMAFLIWILLFQEAANEKYRTITAFGNMLAKLDPDQWSALGIAFPHIRIKWTGKPLKFFEDTDITLEDFECFMQDSDGRQISPERNWANGPDRRKWQMIKDWLEAKEYIYSQSASGNHSWLWRGDMYRILWQHYIQSEGIPNLTELEGSPTPPIFVPEVEE